MVPLRFQPLAVFVLLIVCWLVVWAAGIVAGQEPPCVSARTVLHIIVTKSGNIRVPRGAHVVPGTPVVTIVDEDRR